MSVTLGPKLGLLINANIGESYGDQFRILLRFLDAMIQGSVISSSVTSPPGAPNNGDAYLLLGSPTGAWAGKANTIAVYSTEITLAGSDTKQPGWDFWTPREGWVIWDSSIGGEWVYTQGAWVTVTTGGGGNENLVTVASSPTTSINWATSTSQKTVIASNTTISFTGASAGPRLLLILTQNNTSYNVTWANNILGVPNAPGESGSSTYEFVYDGTNYLLVNDPIIGQ